MSVESMVARRRADAPLGFLTLPTSADIIISVAQMRCDNTNGNHRFENKISFDRLHKIRQRWADDMGKKPKQTIPIFFAVDDNYVPLLAAAIESIKAQSNAKYEYSISILVDKLDEKYRKQLSDMQLENVKIGFVSVCDRLDAICSDLHMRDYYTKATYYRFFIPEMFPQYDRGIYLDCDVIVTQDLAKMYNCKLKDNLVAAVNDEIISDIEVFAQYSEAVLGIDRKKYFNAGILVMNLAAMREEHIEEKFAELLSQKTYRVAQDQDYLNVLCQGRVKYLPLSWNKTPMPTSNRKRIPSIAHFKINFKPWRYDDIPYGELFWQYAAKTPYYIDILRTKATYSDAEKQRDRAQYEGLVRLAMLEIDENMKNKENDTVEIFGDEMFEDMFDRAILEDMFDDLSERLDAFAKGDTV